MLYGIDVFSGAGGLSLGAEMAGIKISHAVEINPSAAKTFLRNHKGAEVHQGDIKDIKSSDLISSNILCLLLWEVLHVKVFHFPIHGQGT